MWVRFRFTDNRDIEVDVPDAFVAQTRALMTQGSMTENDVLDLVLQFEFVSQMSSSEVENLEGSVVVAFDQSIVYTSRRLDDVLNWVAERSFPSPVLITTVGRRDEAQLADAAGDRARARVFA